ncbi:MAG: hypothetical protein HY683_00935 [Chloroflexi bacterium]|nr:hypothetical protein [Chloroflexota bacterium]
MLRVNSSIARPRRVVTLGALIAVVLVAALTGLVAVALAQTAVGPSGGTVSSSDGSVAITFPDGALTESVDVRLTLLAEAEAPAAAPSGRVFGSRIFTVDILKGGTAQSNYALRSLATVVTKYSANDVSKARDNNTRFLHLSLYDAASKTWFDVPGVFPNVAAQTLETQQSVFPLTLAITIEPPPPPTPTPTKTPGLPGVGDVAPSSGMVMGAVAVGALLVLGGGLLLVRSSRRSKA